MDRLKRDIESESFERRIAMSHLLADHIGLVGTPWVRTASRLRACRSQTGGIVAQDGRLIRGGLAPVG